jgi:ribosomal protein L14E/L6E/L27E
MLRGSVVLSLRGRDRNSLLAVTGTDERFIYVADGKVRPLVNPKRKNPKHLRPLDRQLSEAALRSDKSLRRALAIVKSEIQ